MSVARRIIALLLGLPLLGSAIVVLSTPPLATIVPRAARPLIAYFAAPIFALIARLPPSSLLGRAFYGSYAPLVPLFGRGALAAHSALLSAPLLALLVWLGRPPRARRA